MMIDGGPVVAEPAEIDITTAGHFRVFLLDSGARGYTAVVADMTGTVFCDLNGFHTLLRAHKRAMSEGGELRLVIFGAGAVPRVLNLSSLDPVVPCFSSLADALLRPAASAIRHC